MSFRYPLPGGTASVESLRAWLRVVGAASILLGPGYWTVVFAAQRGDRRALHRLERWWARSAASALRIDVDTAGIDHIDPLEQYIVAPLHEGLADPIALLHLPLDLVFPARDELFDWRFVGRYLRASGQVSLPTRNGSAGYRALLREAPRAFARGESLVLFPQGSILGVEAQFHRGVFDLADRLDRPVLPVVVCGTHQVWEHPYRRNLRLDRPVHVEVLEPVRGNEAVARSRSLEREMKAMALAAPRFPVRRFDPDRDGWWDGYPYHIDPDFPELAARVAAHRASPDGARSRSPELA